MKKLFLALILILAGCGSFDNETMFKSNVINPIPDSIKNINMSKDHSAMHGALFFDFESNKSGIALIIHKNNLKHEEEIPDAINAIVSHAPWASETKSNHIQIYGKIVKEKYEWHALYLFVTDKKNYCIKI